MKRILNLKRTDYLLSARIPQKLDLKYALKMKWKYILTESSELYLKWASFLTFRVIMLLINDSQVDLSCHMECILKKGN